MSRESAEANQNARVRVRWARTRLDGVGRGSLDPVRELAAVVTATLELEAAAVLFVAAARDRGASWTVIGAALGVSRQAARQRYAGAVRRRDARRSDWVRTAVVDVLDVREQRGVWEGTTERLRVPEQRGQ